MRMIGNFPEFVRINPDKKGKKDRLKERGGLGAEKRPVQKPLG